VVVGDIDQPTNVLLVSENTSQGAGLMVDHLIEQGHERIALVNAPSDFIFSSNYFAGFRQALVKAGLTINEDFLEESDFSQKEGYRAGQTLLSRSEIPSAIVAADDLVALGVMAAAQDQGFEIGNDLAITGYGDILLSEYSQPPLTTIHRPTYALGERACRMLIEQLHGTTLNETNVVFQPSLVIRQSSDLALWL